MCIFTLPFQIHSGSVLCRDLREAPEHPRSARKRPFGPSAAVYLKYRLFAEDIREATESLKDEKPGPQCLLDKVVTNDQGVFTFDEAVRVYTESGKSPDEKKIRNVLSQWKKRGYILQMTDDRYKKA